MLKVIYGDIFDSNADAILHQVNCQGVMGSGVAKQVREKYPFVYQQYKEACDAGEELKSRTRVKTPLLGYAQVCPKYNYLFGDERDHQSIVNLFAQDKYGYDGKCYTDYTALQECLKDVNERFAGKEVALPYLMACHRGGGDWNIVSKIIEETLTDCDVTIYKYDGN